MRLLKPCGKTPSPILFSKLHPDKPIGVPELACKPQPFGDAATIFGIGPREVLDLSPLDFL